MAAFDYQANVKWNGDLNELELTIKSDYTTLLGLAPGALLYILADESIIRLIPLGDSEESQDWCVAVNGSSEIVLNHNPLSAIKCKPGDRFEIRQSTKDIQLVKLPSLEMILELQKRTGACFDSCKQVLSDRYDPPEDFDEAVDKIVASSENPELEVRGYGFEIEVYELTREQYVDIEKSGKVDLVDSPEWSLRDIGRYSLPSAGFEIYCDDELLDFPIDYNIDSGPTIDEKNKLIDACHQVTHDQITVPGKQYAIRAWESRGSWARFKINDNYFKPKNLIVHRTIAYIGNGESTTTMELYDFTYTRILEDYEASTNGKGVTCYLVDANGNVSRI